MNKQPSQVDMKGKGKRKGQGTNNATQRNSKGFSEDFG